MKNLRFLYVFLMFGILFSVTNSLAQVTKEGAVFDKVVVNPDTTKARISSLTIDIANQQVIVVYQTGNSVDGDFVVTGETSVLFVSEDGKEDFEDVLQSMKFDLATFIDFVKTKI